MAMIALKCPEIEVVVVEIVTRAAVAAISRGEDRITGATLSGLGYVPLSRRRNSALRHEMT